MKFTTPVQVVRSKFTIEPDTRLLFVGSCFATNLGGLFTDNLFNATVNPFGVMYNPVSICHTVERTSTPFDLAFITLGTNHVYVDVGTNEVVDNCRKRPSTDFREEILGVDECCEALRKVLLHLMSLNENVKTVFTVSPIRYAKYGFHESQLSKAVLLLAVQKVVDEMGDAEEYFPAYEIVLDELRDYRFYAPDMLHPSQQAVEYIWQRIQSSFFSPASECFLSSWQPVNAALHHRPLHPESDDYAWFISYAKQRLELFANQYPFVTSLARYMQLKSAL